MTQRNILTDIARIAQVLAMMALSLFAAGMSVLCILSAVGMIPWLSLPLSFGEMVVSQAGAFIQVGLTFLALSLLFVIPLNRRIMTLETTHRDFQICMDDVARAYHVCHMADRGGAFALSSEFDAVRERLIYMRDHPDLARMEPAVLEVAAQMSQQSRHLSEIYSDENVSRARKFLAERQSEVKSQQDKIESALKTTQELEAWKHEIEVDEAATDTQLIRLEESLRRTLEPLGLGLTREAFKSDRKVITLDAITKAH